MIISAEFAFELATPVAKSEFIEEIQRRAEFPGQFDNITAADANVVQIIYLRR